MTHKLHTLKQQQAKLFNDMASWEATYFRVLSQLHRWKKDCNVLFVTV